VVDDLKIGQTRIVDAWIPIHPTTVLLTSPDADNQTWENLLAVKQGVTRHFTNATDVWRISRRVNGNIELIIIDQPTDILSAENLYRWCKKHNIPVLWCDVTNYAWVAELDFVRKPFDADSVAQKVLTHKRGVTGKIFKY
jgi:hypothetical protein